MSKKNKLMIMILLLYLSINTLPPLIKNLPRMFIYR